MNNPYAQFQTEYSLQEILDAPMIYEPLTKLQCSPTSDGSAAAILCSEDFVRKHGLEDQAVEILGAGDGHRHAGHLRRRRLDPPRRLRHVEDGSRQGLRAGRDHGRRTSQVIELHDCFSANELITYEALGLCRRGQGRASSSTTRPRPTAARGS